MLKSQQRPAGKPTDTEMQQDISSVEERGGEDKWGMRQEVVGKRRGKVRQKDRKRRMRRLEKVWRGEEKKFEGCVYWEGGGGEKIFEVSREERDVVGKGRR